MDFSQLPNLPKRKIFKMLSIGSRYNASLVWKEMAEETLKSIFISYSEFTTKSNDMKLFVDNSECLETAGVLAAVGRLDSKKELWIQCIDLSSAPVNIVNSLMKVARDRMDLAAVNGLSLSMLENIQCKKVLIYDLTIPSQVKQKINISGRVFLRSVNGDLCGLFENIKCDVLNIDMTLSTVETRSLTEMFNRRLRILEVMTTNRTTENALDYPVLKNYDGQGQCQKIMFCSFKKYRLDSLKEDLKS